MNEIRQKRIESAIQREISQLLAQRKLNDDRLGLVSITEVRLAPDLSAVTVFVSPFGTDDENRDTWQALKEHRARIQGDVARKLRLRQTPRLGFSIDDRIKEGDRIIQLMEE